MNKKTNAVLSILLCILLIPLPAVPAKAAAAAPSNQKGIDVSGKYNGVVDWESVAAQGYTFAMIRIAEGQAPDVDTQFEANYDGAKAAGLKVGVYHDCCIRTPKEAVLEANYCIELLDGRELDYPVAYDMEKDGTFLGGIENTTAIAKTYSDIIADAGYIPMVYSTSTHLNNDFDWDKLPDVKIWVAHYDTDEPAFDGIYDIWQYTHKGNVEGANTDTGRCDINYSFLENDNFKLSIPKKTLKVNETYSIKTKPASLSSKYALTYKSDKKSVAVVSKNGNIRAKKKGTTLITVSTFNNKTAIIKIVVK